MEILSYFLISLIVYLGLGVGIVLSFMAKEELKPGKKYFILIHNIILAFILFFILEFLKINVFLTLLLPLVISVLLFYFKLEFYKKSPWVYLFFGIIFFIASKNINNLLIISALMFFYGFLISSLQINLKKKNYHKILLKNIGFFVCLVLFFTFY